jgi:hypothetical protein
VNDPTVRFLQALVSIEDDTRVAVHTNDEVPESRNLQFTFVVIIHAYTEGADVALNIDLPALVDSIHS